MIEQYALEVWCLYCAISQAIIAIMLLLSLAWFAAEYFSAQAGGGQALSLAPAATYRRNACVRRR